jgi:Plasmid pRiA4b ORF-3-like protein
MFDAFGRLGHGLCTDGWAESFMRDEFEHTIEGLLLVAYRRGPGFAISEACALAWELATLRYVLDAATEVQLTTARATNDRDVRRALGTLEELGALRLAGDRIALTKRGLAGMRRATGDPEPGDAIFQIAVTLRDVTPRVWRRLLVPAAMRLDRLHDTIQAAMGWTNSHLHAFRAEGGEYGPAFADLDYRDERTATLQALVAEPGGRLVYSYDFGDDWEHDVVIEEVLVAEAGVRYPRCAGGAGRCPPEDCGGSPGYGDLREVLADPARDEHADMLEWLELAPASQFDPAAFDVEAVNAALGHPGARG